MPCLDTTVTVQRMGSLDLCSLTARTIPVTGNPFNITVAFWPRYWAKRQRRASFGSVISIGCMNDPRSRYAKRFRDHLHDIEQPLIMIAIRFDSHSVIALRCESPAELSTSASRSSSAPFQAQPFAAFAKRTLRRKVVIWSRREDAVRCGHNGEQHEQGRSRQSPP